MHCIAICLPTPESAASVVAANEPSAASHDLSDDELGAEAAALHGAQDGHPDRVLAYRLGDFSECCFKDAVELSRLLELTLTGKEGGKALGRVPMAQVSLTTPPSATEPN